MTPITGSTFFFWGALAFTGFMLYRAWIEWRRAGRTRLFESLLVVVLMYSGILLRGAPDIVRHAQSALMGIVVIALIWRDPKAFFRHEPITWLGGMLVALIVIIEIDHDFHRFLSHGAQRALLGLMVAVGAAFVITPIVQLTRLTIEARRVIAEARAMLKTAAASQARPDSHER